MSNSTSPAHGTDAALRTYESNDVVAFYEQQGELQDCEAYLFDKYVPQGAAILDMGVGGGRTTAFLASRASRYVGADYSRAMVDACARRFPNQEFQHCDATDLSRFEDGTFDVMVFSFNGIDHLPDDAARARCLREAARVLRGNGLFLFSSHNARQLALWPSLRGARPHQVAWRLLRSLARSPAVGLRTLRSGAFAHGEGFIEDPVHGGMRLYVSTRRAFAPQLAAAGLEVLEVVRGPDRSAPSDLLTSWHYYACRKTP